MADVDQSTASNAPAQSSTSDSKKNSEAQSPDALGLDFSRYPLLVANQDPAQVRQLDLDQLEELAADIRRCICDQIMTTGGHFASNLCVVELTLALHYVFDFKVDRLIFDVGHQCYPHKLITGRLPLFPKLKQGDGMAGFPDPKESEYDLFDVGHAGTAVSCGVGLARGYDLLKDHRRIVSVVGDSSIVNGLSMEGMNDAGTLKRQFLTILNDNGRAIGDPQGAMAHYFDKVRVSSTLKDLKRAAKGMVEHMPGGTVIEELYHRGSDMIKAAVANDHLFEHMGHLCIGPLDGHHLPTLVEAFQAVKDINRPVLLHVKTVKGKGFNLAEGDPFRFHAPKPSQFSQAGLEVSDCRVEKIEKVEKKPKAKSFTNAFSDAMIDIMGRDEKVVALTAAMPDGTGLDKVMPKFPERTFDIALAEGHGMDVAAGMAKAGIKPFYAVYSTFSQRALDQTFQEAALQELPVRICMDRAGYVGGDGAAMHGFIDITMNRAFPGAVMLAPCDEPTFIAGLDFMLNYEAGPSFIRYPRDQVPATPLQTDTPAFELGKAHLIRPHQVHPKGAKPDLAVLGYGIMVYETLKAIEELEPHGYKVDLYDARWAKPVDIELVEELIDEGIPILTIEDHALTGGFGSAILEAASDRSLDTRTIHRMGHPERWIHKDSRRGQLQSAELDTPHIARKIRSLIDGESKSQVDQEIAEKIAK